MEFRGLSTTEVRDRVSRGEVNSSKPEVSRTYTDILFRNILNPFNLILFILGAVLLLLDDFWNALAATGIVILNITVATFQEIRAKRRLDKIALLLRPKAHVMRDGEELELDQNKIVKDDIIHLRPGDQALVDGVLLYSKNMEVDESHLTGESKTVRKRKDDKIYSGSFCITGDGYFAVTAFGKDSYANQLLSSAKRFDRKRTPLQMETTAITMVLMFIAFVYIAIMVLSNILLLKSPFTTVIQMSVVILEMVPIALFLLIVLAYMIAAVRMADSGALLQRANSVESMSHVDTVCMDKTGTITTNRLVFEEMVPFRDDASVLIKEFVNATDSRNRTVKALEAEYGYEKREPLDQVEFSSERKYSAVKIKAGDEVMNIYMGALSVLGPRMSGNDGMDDAVASFSSKGMRTVVMGFSPDLPLYDADGAPMLQDMLALSVIAISDEIRPDCRETIDIFLDNGMELKVISGDDPATVDALFSIAGLPGKRIIFSGDQLEAMSDEEKTRAAIEGNIFGRMKPNQKVEIVEILKRNGRYVAMVGDGVNDVLALKSAQIGVALQSGSGAARGVADIVLMDDKFSALPRALVEGKRTVSGMRNILKLYLSRNFVLAIIIGIILIGSGMIPMMPTQMAFYAFVTVSVTAFLMTIWAEPTDEKGAVLPEVLSYAVPAAAVIAVFAALIYFGFYFSITSGLITLDIPAEELSAILKTNYDPDGGLNQTAQVVSSNSMLLFLIIAGISQILFITPHWGFSSIDGKTQRDIRPTVLMFLLFGLTALAYSVEPARLILGLIEFPPAWALTIIGISMIWFFTARYALRKGLFSSLADVTLKWYNERLAKEYADEHN